MKESIDTTITLKIDDKEIKLLTPPLVGLETKGEFTILLKTDIKNCNTIELKVAQTDYKK